MRFVLFAALLGSAWAFAPCRPTQFHVARAVPRVGTSSMQMVLGGGPGRKGFGGFGGFGGIGKVIRNPFNNNKGKNGGNINGGGNGNGGNGGNFKFSQSADDEGDDEGPKTDGGIWAAYNQALDTNPIVVKALTSLIGFTVGDILSQLFIEKTGEFDIKRLVRLASFGLLLHGPMGHFFYGWVDGVFPGKDALTVATKVAIDQVLYNPVFGTIFFTFMGFTAGETVSAVVNKVKTDLKTAVVGSWTVWIPVHTLNFRLIPPSQRLLFINTVQIFYNMFLSVIGNRKVESA